LAKKAKTPKSMIINRQL